MRWRIKLSTFDFDIVFRCAEENIAADALSGVKCLSMSIDKLRDVHESLCHPGETRMAHFVSKKLAFFYRSDSLNNSFVSGL